MNVKLNMGYVPGGIFSKFMQMLPNALLYDVDKIYFNLKDDTIGFNPFDIVFEQEYDDTYVDVDCVNLGTYTKRGVEGLGPIEESVSFDKMKRICDKIKFSSVLLALEDYEHDLSVHVRLGDMNSRHPQYGIAYIDDYLSAIDILCPESIFVASDNVKSLPVISSNFECPVFWKPLLYREYSYDFTTSDMQIDNMNNAFFWIEAFTDMLMLSKGKRLLCRVSNLSNAAILFSHTIQEIHRL